MVFFFTGDIRCGVPTLCKSTSKENKMKNHVLEVCKTNNIAIGSHSSGGRASRKSRCINIRPVKSSITYCVALHEIGHILGSKQSSYRLEAEAYAWQWAIDNAKTWTAPMNRKMKKCLMSYVSWAQSKQYRKNAPRIPDKDHVIWKLLERKETR